MRQIAYLIYLLLLVSYINADNKGCSISPSIFENNPKTVFKIREEKKKIYIDLNITKRLQSIRISYENQKINITRSIKSINDKNAYIFYIQPMHIDGIKTVGELEVLNFIKGLKGKEPRLFIDIRKSKEFKFQTIPGAINIPFFMLEDGSKYQNEVLTLLGGKKEKKRWRFDFVPNLIIFGRGSDDYRTLNAIKTLIKISYPKDKISYYRAGIKGWKGLGLTLY